MRVRVINIHWTSFHKQSLKARAFSTVEQKRKCSLFMPHLSTSQQKKMCNVEKFEGEQCGEKCGGQGKVMCECCSLSVSLSLSLSLFLSFSVSDCQPQVVGQTWWLSLSRCPSPLEPFPVVFRHLTYGTRLQYDAANQQTNIATPQPQKQALKKTHAPNTTSLIPERCLLLPSETKSTTAYSVKCGQRVLTPSYLGGKAVFHTNQSMITERNTVTTIFFAHHLAMKVSDTSSTSELLTSVPS